MGPCARIGAVVCLLAVVVASPGHAGPARGVRVRSVERGAAASAAGIRPGDRLLWWRRGGREELLESAAAWLWFEREEAVRGPVVLGVEREETVREVRLEQDDLGIGVVPPVPGLTEEELSDALDGKSEPAAVAAAVRTLLESGRTGAASWLADACSERLGGMGGAAAALADELRAAAARSEDPRTAALARYVAVTLRGAGGDSGAAAHEALEMAGSPGLGRTAPVLRARLVASAGLWLKGGGKLAGAASAFEKAAAVLSDVAPRSLLRARVLLDLAGVRLDLGQPGAAQEALTVAETIVRSVAPGGRVAAGLAGLEAHLAFQRGDLERARGLFEQKLALEERYGAADDMRASTLQNLGVVAAASRRLSESQRYFERALALQEAVDPDSPDAAVILGNVAVLAQYRGDLAASEQMLRRALEIMERRGAAPTDLVPILINLGKLAAEQGDLEGAARHYRRGLKITSRLAPGSDMHATLLADLGWLERRRGNVAEAFALMERALAAGRRSGSPPLRIAGIEENVGRLALDLGRTGDARRRLESALSIRHRVAPGSLEEAKSLDALAALAEADGRPGEAVTRARRAARLARDAGPGTWTAAEILHHLATLLDRSGDRTGAEAAAREALDNLDRQVERLGATDAIRAAFRSRYLPWYRELERWLIADGDPGGAYAVLERGRARALVVTMAERDVLPEDRDEAAMDLRRRELTDRIDAVEAELAAAPDAPSRRTARERLDALLTEMDRLAEAARRESPRLAAIRYPEPLDADSARELLAPGTTALVYSIGGEDTLVYVLRNGSPLVCRTVAVGREAVARMAALFRGLLGRPPSPGETPGAVRAAGRALHRVLVEPVENALAGSRRLVVVPDGPLFGVPFAAFVDRENRYLAERWPGSTVVSLTVLAGIRRRPRRHGTALVLFGDPEPQAATGRPLPPLPGAREEVRRIARGAGRTANVFLGPEATEAAFTRAAPGAEVLHCATHVVVDDTIPLASALVLAPGGGQNGLLQAWEILERVRLGSRIVVLSGCETGLGTALDGEGIVGLTRAFQVAGAASVLHTLWRVEDRSQEALMVRFHRGLEAGLPADEALRAARLAFIRGRVRRAVPPPGPLGRILTFWRLAPREPADHPFYWASPTLDGDWR